MSMKVLGLAAAGLVLVGNAQAAEIAVGRVTMFDEIECAFRLYNGAVFHADERERSFCSFRLKVGATMLVRFDPVDGRNIIRGLQVYEERFTIGNIRSIEGTNLILTTGVRFDLSTLAAPPELNPGDTVEIEFTQTVDRIFESIGDAFADVWNFAAEAYQWAKRAVVDMASALTFGAISEEVLSFALDAALASAGIPPNIPNLDEIISGGIDQLAAEMAKAAVSQIPTADLAVTLGDLAADVTVDAALAMAEEELLERLEEEMERKSREALIAAADEMERAASTPRSGVPCSSRFIPPSYRVTVQNTGTEPLLGIVVNVGDSEGIYWGTGVRVDLDPGQVLSLMAIPEPNIRDIWDNRLARMEPMATSQNTSHWWNEYLLVRDSSIGVALPGHRECLGSCYDTMREVLSAPPQLLTQPLVWP